MLLLWAVALGVSVGLFGTALCQANARRRLRYWARHAHRHQWTLGQACYLPDPDHTVLLESCSRCPAVQVRKLPGAWIINRLGELSPVAVPTETDDLERFWRVKGRR